jgi:pyruvate dehydrogenase E1 component alpha subunit
MPDVTTATRTAPGAAAPDERERSLFSTMLRLRRFEEKAGMLYALGTLGTPCPLGIGREAAFAAIAASIPPGDIVVALRSSPALELALGTAAGTAFQRLLPMPQDEEADQCLVRMPGEGLRHLAREAALALVAQRTEAVVPIATSTDDLAAALRRLPNRVLPVMIVSTDRKPDSWSPLAPLSVRECDGADAIGLCETIATVRNDLEPGHTGTALAILTPPYAGHARDVRGRAPPRREAADPIALCRQRLLAGGRLDEAGVCALEAAVRDEIAAAGRSIALACTR